LSTQEIVPVPQIQKAQHSGWLTNTARRERRDRPNTLTDQDIRGYIQKIKDDPDYCKLDSPADRFLKTRDCALIALNWIFFKRAGEVLSLKLGDITLVEHGKYLSATFSIQKKREYILLCSYCSSENKGRNRKDRDEVWRRCANCGESLEGSKRKTKPAKEVVTKRKRAQHEFCKVVWDWIGHAGMLSSVPNDFKFDPDAWLFPRMKNDGSFDWHSKKHLARWSYDRILQRIDPTMTSSMFRYGRTESLLSAKDRRGRQLYSIRDLVELGDWSGAQMPETYAKRKGLSDSQARFQDDMIR
jgi:integrase